jgi:Cytosine/adenosine deaminases
MTDSNEKFMREAIRLSLENIDAKNGGPFGAVIVKDGEIISRGVNGVTTLNDPTAHAEVTAIREAAKKLNNYNLTGCVIYTSCEPCPMCLSAIYWARLDAIYYANTKKDAAEINFDDKFIHDEHELPLEKRKISMTQLLRDEAIEAFNKWDKDPDKLEY